MNWKSAGLAVFLALFAWGYGSSAHALCANPRVVCQWIFDCLQNGPGNDKSRILQGVKDKNGNLIWEATRACRKDKGSEDEWDKESAGCADAEYVTHGERAVQGIAACH